MFSLPSFAKLNWTLRVLGKRDDGFHELCTVFQTISLNDVVEFSVAERLIFSCDRSALAADENNLVLRAAKALKDRFPDALGAAIHLTKNIPFPGGLGGGSSNAAVTLIGLVKLWKIEISSEDLHSIAAELGSDVPFFLYGGTAVGTSRGELIEQVDDVEAENMLVVTPEIAVSTAEAFARLNADALTSAGLDLNLTVCRNEAESLDPLNSVLKNDFERTVFAAYPEIERVKNTLLDLGAANAAMSGSGASVFAIFDNKETRQAAIKALDREITWRKFAVSTISRNQYREALDF